MFLLCTRHSMEEHVGMTSFLTFFNKWISYNLDSSGREAQVSSLPRQSGVTEFLQKYGFILITNGP